MNTKQTGDIGVAKAIYYYTALGYTVSIPNTDNAKYDLIVDNGKLLRVQVKTTSYKVKSGSYQANLKTCGGNQSWSGIVKYIVASDTDLALIVCDDGSMYEFPSNVIAGKTNVTLGEKYNKYKVALDRW